MLYVPLAPLLKWCVAFLRNIQLLRDVLFVLTPWLCADGTHKSVCVLLACQPNACGQLTNLVLALVNMPFLHAVNSFTVPRWYVSRLKIICETFKRHFAATLCIESGCKRGEMTSD